MQPVKTFLGGLLAPSLVSEATWAVKLDNGRFLSERDSVRDGNHPLGSRPFDWTLDLVATGDIRRVKELWLLCPPNPTYPEGQAARFLITQPYTAFQLKVGQLSVGVGGTTEDEDGRRQSNLVSQMIGRLDDPAGGACSCYVWDADLRVMGFWSSNVYAMGSWREEIAPLGRLDPHVLGYAPAL